MFFAFGGRVIRKEHVTTLTAPEKRVVGFGAESFVVAVSLLNGERIAASFQGEGEAREVYSKIKETLGVRLA